MAPTVVMRKSYSFSRHFVGDRAKQIKTKASVNEDPTEALIRELKEQNEALKKQLATGKVDDSMIREAAGRDDLSKEELEALKREWLEEMKANMDGNDKEVEELRLSYEEKLREAQRKGGDTNALAKIMHEKKNKPHIFNLNFDPQLSGKVVHILHAGEMEIGNTKGKPSDIPMAGPGYKLLMLNIV